MKPISIVFATNNSNKIEEVQAQLPSHIKLLSLEDIGCQVDLPETQLTIMGNAIQKATYIKENFNMDCFADDTGLEVYSLDGAPGVCSARYAGPQKNTIDNINKLLTRLKDTKERSAQFKTVIALHWKGQLSIFEGLCEGQITTQCQGTGGFGYDPIFRPLGYNQTFAEIERIEKNRIGHRGKAVEQLISFLNTIK